MRKYYVYILASKKNGTLYTGVTNDIVRRIHEHKTKVNEGFTKKYNVDRLVYFEEFVSIIDSITREKRIKAWKRQWKIELIEKLNPKWVDLYNDLI